MKMSAKNLTKKPFNKKTAPDLIKYDVWKQKSKVVTKHKDQSWLTENYGYKDTFMDRKLAIEEGTICLDRDEQEDIRLNKQMRNLIQILNNSNTTTINLEEHIEDEPTF